VIERLTFLIDGAGVRHGARIGTNAVETGSICGAILQVGAANSFAAGVGIAFRSGWTFANRSVVDSLTDGPAFAGDRRADRFALSVDASVRSRTFLVHRATHLVASH